MKLTIRGADYKTSAPFILPFLLLALCGSAAAQSVPVLLSPADGVSIPIGDTLKGLVTLDWSDVADATGYNVDIQGPLGFWNVFPEAEESELIFRTSLTGEYQWRVRAYLHDDTGPFSQEREFTVTGDVRPTPSKTPTSTPTPIEKSDANQDGSVNHKDLFKLAVEWSALANAGDLNADGAIDSQDFLQFINKWHR